MLVITIDDKALAGSLLRAPKSQLAYALALALTRTARQSQEEMRGALAQRFTLRNNFIRNAIRFDRATKRNLEAVIGVATSSQYNTDFMERQEFGGLKTPQGRHLAVPVNVTGRNKRGIIRKSQRPRVLLNNEKLYFTGLVGKRYGLWKREKAVKGQKSRKLTLVYGMPTQGRVRERLQLRKTVTIVMNRHFSRFLFEAIDLATRTAR